MLEGLACRVSRSALSLPTKSLRRAAPARCLNTSPAVLAQVAVKDVETEDGDAFDDDLFSPDPNPTSSSSASTSSSPGSSDLKRVHSEILSRLSEATDPTLPLRTRNRVRYSFPNYDFGRFIKSCQTKEEFEAVRKVLRAWRVMGREVSQLDAQNLIERSVHLGMLDFLTGLLRDPSQYGINSLYRSSAIAFYNAYLDQPTLPSNIPRIYSSYPNSRTLRLFELALALRRQKLASSGESPKTAQPSPSSLSERLKQGMSQEDGDLSEDDIVSVGRVMQRLEDGGKDWAAARDTIMSRTQWDEAVRVSRQGRELPQETEKPETEAT